MSSSSGLSASQFKAFPIPTHDQWESALLASVGDSSAQLTDPRGNGGRPGEPAIEAIYTGAPARSAAPVPSSYRSVIAARIAASEIRVAMAQIKDAATDGAESVTLVIRDSENEKNGDPAEGIPVQSAAELSQLLGSVSARRLTAVLECGIYGAPVIRMLSLCDGELRAVVSAVRAEPAHVVDPALMAKEWTELSEAAQGVPSLSGWHCVDARPVAESGGSMTQELAFALALFASRLRQAKTAGVDPQKVLHASSVLCSVGSHVFLETAKIRAMRVLFDLFVRHCGSQFRVPLEVCSARWNRTRDEPHMNILRAAAALLASRSAGIERTELHPFAWGDNAEESLARQVAVGTQHVLRHEAAFGSKSDLMEGCFYVESLTARLAEEAWELFQSYEARGGLEWMIREPTFAESIAAVAKARVDRVVDGSDVFVGLNRFRSDAVCRAADLKSQQPRPTIKTGEGRRSLASSIKFESFCVQRVYRAAAPSAEHGVTVSSARTANKSGEGK